MICRLKYKLFNKDREMDINEAIDYGVIEYALENRGVQNVDKYIRLKESECVCDFSNLNNINEAVELFNIHIENKDPTAVLVDPDVDGYTSAAMIYTTIKKIDDDYPITYLMHSASKAHGLAEDITIPPDTKFLIIPDASTNDTEMCKYLKEERGIDVLILDHHQRDESIDENVYACIVNNQLSDDYWNKDFCGAGIVYKFLQALDDENWTDYADDYLDLVALANISDNMDIRSLETKYYINLGLHSIKNKCFKGFIKAQDFRMKGHVNIHNVQWYITPLINGMIRVGSFNDKELLFKAFLEEDQEFEYKKRATKNNPAQTVIESIYERVPRICSNAKGRQDRQKNKGIEEIRKIVDENPFNDKIIMIDATEVLDKSLSGLVAMKIADIYNKPCIILKKYKKNDDPDNEVYGGSARNINYSPIDNLRDVVISSNEFNFASGHDNAFGVEIEIDKFNEAINKFNQMLKDVEYDSTYRVDFIIDSDDVNIGIIKELSVFPDYLGTKIDELLIAVENISLNKNDFRIVGRKEDTIKFSINDVEFIEYSCDEKSELYNFLNDAWNDEDYVTFTVVGEPCISEFNGVLTPQISIKDVNIIETSLSEEDEDVIW